MSIQKPKDEVRSLAQFLFAPSKVFFQKRDSKPASVLVEKVLHLK